MDEVSIARCLEDLKQEDEAVRQRATETLWRIWFEQKGDAGLERLQRAQLLFDSGKITAAEAMLTKTIQDYPDFAEAWNRRAVLYYLRHESEKSRSDCEEVVRLNPVHFGAWHGLGLCQAALGNYRDAIAAFQKALDLQPYASVNQKLILECTMHL
ncbi:MAG: tetratricopeptide repeat protein [Cyanobacteriota bacterium]|nr:tetratricopeptide repeat protein [Cyanobacteriota bacterium]